MSTTTVRLPDDLKRRLADVAERAGMTSHALILQAFLSKVMHYVRLGPKCAKAYGAET